MDGSSTEDYGAGDVSSSQTERISAGQRCQSIDSLAEWRSSEQLENGMPSTSPPYWDTDEDDDDDCGLRPSDLFGNFTWKIENYSQINKRELRSSAFEVGGYQWYILIYPQGCDVCNHLSLFLCVANHDKLLPGWSHFAQFTIAVINKDPKFSKFSDTLHRFWKKEHDWGWKKFMELSKVEDGFIDNETLVIKAQVQVIREKAHRLFRCLACEYRRELIRIYLSNVEQICRRFFEDRKNKLSKLIDDKVRWSSFCSFWLGIDQNSRRRISRDKLDTILRVVVKHFFVEKEVTSTLVMDSLYSGLKALECQSKNQEERLRMEVEESAVPMVRVDKDMFVLADDVIALLERVASEPLPAISLPPKDDKIFQNRTKEGSSADGFKDSIERDERRLTVLGRRTIEIFVLCHIFSRIEVAYQEAIALKRQEELIREEEAAGQAEYELKTKRATAEKDKRTKKKQGKQKRNNRKNKEKQRDLKPGSVLHNKKHVGKSLLSEIASGELSLKHGNVMNERTDTPEDASDVSYNCDDVAETLYPDLGQPDRSPRNWDTDSSELHPSVEASASEMPTFMLEKMNLGLDDSSSTCSTDSVPSVVSNGTHKGNSMIINNIQTSPNRPNNSGNKHLQSHPAEIPDSSPSSFHGFEGDDVSQKSLIQPHEIHLVEKQEPAATLLKKALNDRGDAEKPPNTRQLESSSSSTEPGRKTPPVLQQSKQSLQNYTAAATSITPSTAPPSSNLIVHKRSTPQSAASPSSSTSRSEPQKLHTISSEKNTAAPPATPFSGPSGAPLIPVAAKPNTPAISTSHSATATSSLAANPSPFAPSYIPQSYRNAIIGKSIAGSNPVGFASSSQSTVSSSTSPSSFLPPSTSRKEHPSAALRSGLTFGSINPEASCAHQPLVVTTNTELRSSDHRRDPVSTPPSYQPHGYMVDEFPHLDIINDLLDEEQSVSNQYYHPLHHRHRSFSGRYSFPVDAVSIDLRSSHTSGRFDQSEQYYDDSFLSIYGSNSSARALERLHGGRFAQVDFSTAYANCQWPYNPADLSLVNLGGMEGGGGGVNSYDNISDYANLRHGMNQYGLYRP